MDDAVSLAPANGPTTTAKGVTTENPNKLKATVSNNESVMLLAKYTWNQLKVFGGYENINFTNPSSEFESTKLVFTALGGFPALNQGDKFASTKNLQIMWTGAEYAVTSDVDVAVAYNYIQGSYFLGSAKECSNSRRATAAGTLDAVSAIVDSRFAKKFDTYAGVMSRSRQWPGQRLSDRRTRQRRSDHRDVVSR